MHGEVNAVLDDLLKIWTGEGSIDHGKDVVQGIPKLRKSLEVQDGHLRVAWRLSYQHLKRSITPFQWRWRRWQCLYSAFHKRGIQRSGA